MLLFFDYLLCCWQYCANEICMFYVHGTCIVCKAEICIMLSRS